MHSPIHVEIVIVWMVEYVKTEILPVPGVTVPIRTPANTANQVLKRHFWYIDLK